jgi:phosphatidate phosphatase LPIN
MQYVRSISGSVSKTWNSINPATLSGAIDVIVIEQEDGTYELLKLFFNHTNFAP